MTELIGAVQSGALAVRATTLDWLVVRGAVATIHGAGTLGDALGGGNVTVHR